jgi:hypothetical protein
VPLVLIPPLVALLMRKPDMLPGYEPLDTVVDAQVAALLKGEQLVPPASLPPVAFTPARSSWCGRCWSTPAATGACCIPISASACCSPSAS